MRDVPRRPARPGPPTAGAVRQVRGLHDQAMAARLHAHQDDQAQQGPLRGPRRHRRAARAAAHLLSGCPAEPARYVGAMQPGEVGIEITPILAAPSLEPEFAAQLDALLRRTCLIARALTGAEQAAVKLWVGEDSSQARKYFSMSEKYAAFGDFRVDPKGEGLHGMRIPPGEVIRLTEAEV